MICVFESENVTIHANLSTQGVDPVTVATCCVSQPHMNGNCPVTMFVSRHCSSMGFRPTMILEKQISADVVIGLISDFLSTMFHLNMMAK